jgi:SAM-dependent methyltransferase
MSGNDPIGTAILDFAESVINHDIIVRSEICDDDIIPSCHLFRSGDEMPELERIALTYCKGKILDVGAGAGVHAKDLQEKGLSVHCIDTSAGAVKHMRDENLKADQISFMDFEGKFDTILLLMNGIGIAGRLELLDSFLTKLKSMLNENGQVIFDSTDVKYLYENEDGSIWTDLSNSYYGNFRFQMVYKDHTSDWFDWLYIDESTMSDVAERNGFGFSILHQEESHYLASLKIK